jgi:hypothetical protein
MPGEWCFMIQSGESFVAAMTDQPSPNETKAKCSDNSPAPVKAQPKIESITLYSNDTFVI